MGENLMKLSKYTFDVAYEGDVILYNLLNSKRAVFTDVHELNTYHALKQGEKIPCSQLSQGMRLFCVDENIDETRVALGMLQSGLWDKRQLNFIMLPTMNCMFQCQYCYEEKSDVKVDADFLDDFVHAIEDYHKENPLQQLGIEWYGGEPLLLYDDIVSVTKKLNALCDREGIQHVYSMTTNAYLLSYEHAEELIGLGINYFQITIDGTEETHNQLRPHKNGSGTWRQIIDNLMALQKSDLEFKVMIRVNYNRDVLEGLSEFHEFIASNFDKRFTIFYHVISKWGGENDDCMEVIDGSTAQYIDNLLVEEAVNNFIKPDMNFRFSRFNGRVCYANRPYFYILSYDRKLRKCTFTDAKYDCFNVVGELKTGRMEFDHYKLLNFVVPDYKSMYEKGCFDCSILPICQGLSCGLRRNQAGLLDCTEEKLNIDDIVVQEYRYYKMLKEKKELEKNDKQVEKNISK